MKKTIVKTMIMKYNKYYQNDPDESETWSSDREYAAGARVKTVAKRIFGSSFGAKNK